MVFILRALHSQSSGGPRAGESFDWRWFATQRCARLGCRSRSNDSPRWRDWLFLPGEGFHVLARLNHGACWRRIFLSGGARRSGRDDEARKKLVLTSFCAGVTLIGILNLVLRVFSG